MENINLYKRALNKWNFIKTFYFKLAIVILFNISYMCFLYFRKGELMNHVSLYFLFFSVMYLAYHILKFVLINFFMNSNKNFTLEKKEIFFFSHVSFFLILLMMNVIVDLNRTVYKKDIFEWVLLFDEFKSVYTIKPISSNTPMTKMVLFDKAKQFIHMSATIGGIEQYTKNLGITDYVYFEIDHPIPVKNRKIFTDNTLHINYQTDPKIIVKTIDGIIKNELVNGNGVIHTVSFKLAQDIKKYSAYSKYMMVSNNRAEILDKLSKSKNTIILIVARFGNTRLLDNIWL